MVGVKDDSGAVVRDNGQAITGTSGVPTQSNLVDLQQDSQSLEAELLEQAALFSHDAHHMPLLLVGRQQFTTVIS